AAVKVMRRLSRDLCARLRAHYLEVAAAEPSDGAAQGVAEGPDLAQPPRRSGPDVLPRLQTLRTLPVFCAFDALELEALLASMRVLEVARGGTLFAVDNAAEACFITVRGAIQLTVAPGRGIEPVATLGPGRLFGHLELIDAGRRAVG